MRTTLRPWKSGEDFYDEERRKREARWGQVKQARIKTARSNTNWLEVPQNRLVPRGPLRIDSETDAAYILRPGAVFDPERADIAYLPSSSRLAFFVDEATGDIVFLEPTGLTWTEILERRNRRKQGHAQRQEAFRAQRQKLIAQK